MKCIIWCLILGTLVCGLAFILKRRKKENQEPKHKQEKEKKKLIYFFSLSLFIAFSSHESALNKKGKHKDLWSSSSFSHSLLFSPLTSCSSFTQLTLIPLFWYLLSLRSWNKNTTCVVICFFFIILSGYRCQNSFNLLLVLFSCSWRQDKPCHYLILWIRHTLVHEFRFFFFHVFGHHLKRWNSDVGTLNEPSPIGSGIK